MSCVLRSSTPKCERFRGQVSSFFPLSVPGWWPPGQLPGPPRADLALKIRQRPPQSLVAAHFRRPTQQLLRSRDVRLAHARVVLRQRAILDGALAAGQFQDLLGELE